MADKQHVSLQLPWEVRAALLRASKTPVSFADPLARLKAVEKATEQAKAAFPKLFKG